MQAPKDKGRLRSFFIVSPRSRGLPLQCQENQPACHNCMRIKVPCVYQPRHCPKPSQPLYSPSLETTSLQSTPTIFSPSDMRLFHHFIVNAYPHLPVGNDSVWVREIASFSHTASFSSPPTDLTSTNLHQVRFPHASNALPLRRQPNSDLYLPALLLSSQLPRSCHQRSKHRPFYPSNM